MGFEQFIAFKHLTRRRKTGFISLISLISVGGVGVGVMALIVVLGVMSGFDRELKSKIVSVQPHLRVEKIGGVDSVNRDIQNILDLNIPNLQSISPYVEGQAIVRSERNATGVIVKGLDAVREDLSIFKKRMSQGAFDLSETVFTHEKRRMLFFKKTVTVSRGSILIGENLARSLGVGVGDRIRLISPFQGKESVAQTQHDLDEPLIVKGIFKLGMSDFDSALVVIDIARAQSLYGLGHRVTGLSVRFHDVEDAQTWKWAVRGRLSSGYVVRTWYDMNENFFQALKVEKSVMAILLTLIVLVAAFNIVSTLIMVVMEKTKDIGILRAIGATKASIRRIFILEGFSIGFSGVILGAVSGLCVAFNLNAISDFLKRTVGIEVFPSDIYYFDKIPVEIHSADVVIIVSVALVVSILAGLYPAHRGAGLNPVAALRYE